MLRNQFCRYRLSKESKESWSTFKYVNSFITEYIRNLRGLEMKSINFPHLNIFSGSIVDDRPWKLTLIHGGEWLIVVTDCGDWSPLLVLIVVTDLP